MYDELVKRLRNCATQAAPCDACGLIGDISCSDNLMKQAADAIEELQTDMRPVVRGKWIWTVANDEYLGEYWKCNLCGEHSYIGYNYCPNCGAKMDGEQDV